MFAPTEGAVVDGRFRLVREIGRGGMGAVWECFDDQLQAPCALKFILDSFATNEQLRARFLREARAIAKLQSPHAVSVWSVGEWDGALFIAMELLRGESLQDRLDREQRLSGQDLLALVEQVSTVLSRAHDLGIVHRDLKPDNLWLWEGPRLFVKVLDFGIAKHASEADGLRTASGVMMGTPYYMSPEQAAGNRAVDYRSDLWSLAVIVTVCLTGRKPFESTGIGDLLLQIIDKPVPPLAALGYPASADLEAWWATATARDPERRFQSATALTRALEQALSEARPSHVSAEPQPMGGALVARDSGAPVLAAASTPAAANTVEPLAHTNAALDKRGGATGWYFVAAAVALIIGGVAYFVLAGGDPELDQAQAKDIATADAPVPAAPGSPEKDSKDAEQPAAPTDEGSEAQGASNEAIELPSAGSKDPTQEKDKGADGTPAREHSDDASEEPLGSEPQAPVRTKPSPTPKSAPTVRAAPQPRPTPGRPRSAEDRVGF